MSVVLEGAPGQQLLDGHWVDLYAGQPRTAGAQPLQSLQFSAASPSLTLLIDLAKNYTLVVRGAGAFRVSYTPD